MKAKKKVKKSATTTTSPNVTLQKNDGATRGSKNHQKENKVKQIMDEMMKLSHLNEKLQFAEESVDRLEIAVKQQLHSESPTAQAEDKLIHNHLACAKTEVSKLRSANDQAAVEVKDNQIALDKMEEAKAERKLALKRLDYDVNVIEKEGRKLAKEYEKVLSINIEDIIETTVNNDQKEPSEPSENEEEIYALLNSTSVSIISNKTDQAEND